MSEINSALSAGSTEQIKKLILEVRENPAIGRLSEIRVELSGWYATLSQELEDILVFKADRWIDLRKDQSSDKSTDRAWDATEEGKRETRLRIQLKYIEKVMSSISFRLKVKEGESWGRY